MNTGAWWNVNAHNRLSFAAAGELTLTIDAFDPGRPEDRKTMPASANGLDWRR